ncbi:zinc-finger domain-containing protein [Sphingomonas sp. NCPPB 2930]
MTASSNPSHPSNLAASVKRPVVVVELVAADLNANGGVFCPSPKADMKLWNTHPKVYLDVAHSGEAKCPYCGTVYRLRAGETVRAGH